MGVSTRKRRLALACLLVLVMPFGLVLWSARWTEEEYAVDSAAVKEAFDESPIYVILDTTQPEGRFGISGFHSRGLGLSLSARLSYTTRNVFLFHIPPKLQLPHPYRLVNQRTLDRLVKSNPETRQSAEFQELLAKSWGVITLSRVGFDHSMKHAVMYIQLTYCGLCGEGTYLYLSKETGQWHIVARSGTWIS